MKTGVVSERVFMAGDSVHGDVLAAISFGVKPEHCVLVPAAWSMYRNGADNLPDGVIRADQGFGRLAETLVGGR